jgi:hypothetical protein
MNDLEDHVINMFEIRSEGKRRLFYTMMNELAISDTRLANALVPLIPIYGYWKDLWILWHSTPELKNTIDDLVLEQFITDQESENPSMLAKWLPREGSKQDKKILAKHFANLLFPMVNENSKMKTYRKTCSALNKILDTTEIKMCAGEWDLIDFNTVRLNVLKRYEKGFLRHDRERYLERMRLLQMQERQQMQSPQRQERQPIKDAVHHVFSGLKPIPPSMIGYT